jgi:hypothetical protein
MDYIQMIIRLIAIYVCFVVAICSAPVLAADTTQYQALPNSHIGLVLGMSHSEYKALTGLEPRLPKKRYKANWANYLTMQYKMNSIKLEGSSYVFDSSFEGCSWALLAFDENRLVRINHCLDNFDEAAFIASFGSPSYIGTSKSGRVLAWCSVTHSILVENIRGIWYQIIAYPRRTRMATAKVDREDVTCPIRKR